MSETNNKPQVSQEQLEVLQQLLKPEVQESLNVLAANLPKLAEMSTLLTKTYDFAQSVATDEVLKKDTVSAISEMSMPVVDSTKKVAQIALEAKERAEVSNETIGVFGLMKMLKDPQVQKMFRFVNAFLEVTNERQAKK